LRAGITVSAIYTPGVGHFGHSYWQTYWGQIYLSQLADETGGEAYYIGFTGPPVSFTPFLEDAGKRLMHQYLLTFLANSLALSSPRTDFDRAFVLKQVQLAIHLHRASRVILMSHSDCATYGGVAAFNGDREREMEHHAHELCRASTLIRTEFHGLLVESVFLTFDDVQTIGDEECAES
jgi:hypothetical protein